MIIGHLLVIIEVKVRMNRDSYSTSSMKNGMDQKQGTVFSTSEMVGGRPFGELRLG